MSIQEEPNKLPSILLLDEKKKIAVLNNEHLTIFQAIKKELESDKYNSPVTMQNFKSMKESSNELGKTSKFISKFRIEKKQSEMTEINEFDKNLKGYCSLIDEQQLTIKAGLNVFEEETRKKILALVTEHLEFKCNEQSLRVEFRNINISDMTLSKYATAKMQISKAGKEEVAKRVNEKLALQNKIDNRILSLENECLKANIEPLTAEHIQGFLYENDETYKIKLDSLISAEISRNERVKEQAKIKADNEAKEKVLQEQKAEKAELEARYSSRIRTAQKDDLLIINIELQSYSGAATFDLKQESNKRLIELEKLEELEKEPIKEDIQEIQEQQEQQEQHLRDIAKERPAEPTKPAEPIKKEVAKDGKVERTLSIKIKVPEKATNEQVIKAVIGMIKADKLPLEMLQVN